MGLWLIATRLAGSFAIADEDKPRVINLDFPAPPSGGARSTKLAEHGERLQRGASAISF